jgi:hypothetical protein
VPSLSRGQVCHVIGQAVVCVKQYIQCTFSVVFLTFLFNSFLILAPFPTALDLSVIASNIYIIVVLIVDI